MVNQQNPANQIPKRNYLPTLFLIIVLLVAVAALAVFALNSRNNSTEQTAPSITEQSAPQANASLHGEYEPQAVAPQEIVNISVYVTSETPINTVVAYLNYPKENFEFVGIDGSKSPFTVEAEGKEENGTIKITRGSLETQTGKQLVATIQLRALNGSDQAELTFAEGSQVIAPPSATNILGDSPNVTITLEED